MSEAALDRISRLTPAKQKLLQQRLKKSAAAQGQPPLGPTPLRGTTDRFPCSFAQQRLWFLQQLEPASAAYNSSSRLRLRGPLDRPALARAFAEVIRRHEILRTTFELEDEPVQVVATSVPADLPLVDLTAIAGSAELPSLFRDEAHLPFDLSRRAPWRITLVELEKDEHVVLLTLHHIVTDAWSMAILVQELTTLYRSFSQRLSPALPELEIQYADFACWQRQRLSGSVLESELAYWREQLGGLPPALELPLDHPRVPGRAFRSARCSTRLSAELLESLQALSRGEGATLFMTLLAAFAALLLRYTGREDIAVGSPLGGRSHLRLENIIGCFVNTLVLRLRLTDDLEFRELLRGARQVTLGAYGHQDLPIEKLMTELQPKRDLARAPLYQIMLVLQNAPTGALQSTGLTLESLPVEGGTAKLDLIVNASERTDGLVLLAEYDGDLFDAATMQRFLRHFATVLAGAAAAPAAPAAALAVLAEEERHALVLEWNDTAAGEMGCLVPALFRRRAELEPAAIAVLCGDETLTYGQLLARSGQLARYLRRRGVGPESRVGLCMERVPHLLVGILGILQTGAAYVPLDPALPVERLAFILADALGGLAVPILITQESLTGRFPSVPLAKLGLLRLDADWAEISAETAAGGDLPRELSPEALAYVLYTSGSTGRPKGVAVHHGGLSNYLAWCVQAYAMAAGAGAPVHSSIGFDLTVTSLLAPLLAGRPSVLLPEEDAVPGLAAALRRREGYSLVKLTPAHLRALAQLLSPEEAPGGARVLVVGGEALLAEDLAFWRQHAPATAIVNEYGPTETVVGCAVHRVTVDTPDHGPVPIGRPIANTRAYLLDRRLRPVPQGAIGELYIGGAGVARGYLGRPDLTAERFLPDPLTGVDGEAGSRVYRTGDLARFLADGRLDFLGRADDQVKLRGYRIEPGEIESALGAHAAVREAAVVLRAEGGNARLVAYLVPAPEGRPATEDLRSFLAERLPDYMVPSAFVYLESLPLTPNGKVDRRDLSRLAPAAEPRPGAVEDAGMPRHPVEELLAAVWREVLGLARVGIHDNFFELGGDSILSLQVTSRMRKKGWRVSSRQMFAGPTIAELAAVAQPIQPAAGAAAAATGTAVPLTPIQCWFFAQGLPCPEHFNQSLLLELRPLGPGKAVHAALLGRAVEHLMAHHDTLRSRFEPPAQGQTSWRQLIDPGPLAAPPLQIDLAGLPADRQRAEIEKAAARLQTSLDLARAPLLRAALFTLGEGAPDRLLMVAHHLITDGVSWRILLEDLESACRQLARGEAVELPPRTSSFRQWAEHLVEHARSGALEAQAGFWLELLRGPVAPLPVDRGDGPNDVASADVAAAALDAAETRALLQEVPRAYHTQINDVLLTALTVAFAEWTGSHRLLIDLEGHGREEIAEELDTSRTVGWFTAIYPVLLDLDDDMSPGEALKSVKERLRSVPDRGVGYGLLRYLGEGEVVEALRALPTSQVIFNFHGQLDQIVAEDRLFRGAAESAGAFRSPAQPRPYLLEVSASITGGRLRTAWIYGKNRHLRATIEALVAGFLSALRRIVAHARAAEPGYVPSDFPLARLDQATLDRISSAAPEGIEDLYPASPVQQGMLFHTLRAPESGVYVEQLSLVIDEDDGELDVTAFEEAWQQLVNRHTILRTAFVWRGAEPPLQVVRTRVSLAWDRHDWRGFPPADQRPLWEAFLEADRRRSFDIAAAPLLRLALIRLGERSYQFLWSHHHVLLDGWSNSILLREVFQLYEACRRHEPLQLAPPRPFRNYISWLNRQDMAAAEEFWRRFLAGFSAPTPLAVDRLAAIAPASRRSSCQLVLSAAITDELRSFARRQGLTLSTLMHGAWAALLGRYSGRLDVLFGTVTSGRSAPLQGIEEMIGIFINTLPMRVCREEGEMVSAWLQGIQARHAEASQFEHSPLTQVQGWSEVPRGGALFESILAFENYPVDEVMEKQAGRALGVRALDASGQTNYALAMTATVGARWNLRALFDSTRFDAVTVERMLRHLENLLKGLCGGDRAVGSLQLLHEVERQQLLEWNATDAEPASEATLAELFEMQVDRAPDLPAVVGADGEARSYGEVEVRANRLANLLRSLGVGAGDLVAVQLERSPAMVEAVLGIAKSGAAYVPLEITYPAARVQWILHRMEVCAMVLGNATLAAVADLLPQLPELQHLISLGDSAAPALPQGARLWRPPEIAACSPSRPVRLAGPEDLAYVIFTSGSTGAPKGVMVRHRPAVNLIGWVNRTFGVGPGDRVLFITSLCFDLSVYDVFGVLAAGGTVRVAAGWELADPQALARVLAAEPITFWDSAPAALQQLAPFLPKAIAAGGGGALRLVFLSGDWVPLPLPGQVRGSFPGARVIALGGATEATVWSNFFSVEDVPPEWRSVPYGRPIHNARYYVLDGQLDPCPIGVPGDLYIAGGCLSSGYASAPELTADRYLPDLFAALAGDVMYRTGDRASFFPDGNLEFLGRLDHQVKIRGFRIELGEVEAALRQHPAVSEALVLAREDRPGDKVLTAYVVPRAAGTAPAAAELRHHLDRRLPEYMLPAAFVFLEAVPLTANGKVDRKALPAPGWTPGGDFAAPRSPYEELIAGLFAEVLQIDRAGRDEDFFALGGHSLLATQLASRLREALGVEIALRRLFEAPTVVALALEVEAALQGAAAVAAPALERVPREGPLRLSFGQQRLWFLDQLAPGSSAYHIPSAFLLRGALDIPVLHRAFDEIIRRHEVLRTVFHPFDGEPLQVIGPPRPLRIPKVDLRSLPAERRRPEVERLTAAEARLPFDLTRGPLLRITLLHLEAEAHAVLATLHHIVSDGWSQGLLIEELSALYESFAAGEPSPLPELPIQYADFSEWQRHWLSGAVLERELAYWRAQLRDLPPALDFTTDHPRSARQSSRGEVVSLRLPPWLADDLRALARRRGATLFMTLLAALNLLLSRWSGQTDILVGAPVAGRVRAELEGLIGFFLNTLALRTDLSGEPTFSDLLVRVRSTALGAYSHQAMPFERLLLELNVERELGRTPVFQVLFNMMNLPQPTLRQSRFVLEPMPAPDLGAKFDLTVYATEEPRGIALALVFDSGLFERGRIEALAEQLAGLLGQLAERPDEKIGGFSLVTDAARSVLPDPTAALEAPAFEPVSQLFLSLSRRLPRQPAVRQGERTWTYGELAAWALAFGRGLAVRGIGPGAAVAVSGQRCHELIGSLLAVVLRGGVLLLLDRKLPAARQRAMLAQARAAHVVYVGEPRPEDQWMWEIPEVGVLPAPLGDPGLAEPPEGSTIPVPTSDDPAYVFFTSGTSGEPKGILGRQKGLAHFLAWQRETFGIGTGDRVAQLTGLSFDVVLRDIFLPLTSGAVLCLPEDDDLSPERVLPWLETQAVTVLHTVPSLAGLWLGRVPPGVRPRAVRWVFFAGEPLTDRLVEQWREAFPETGGIVNLYGPTETTLAKCFYRVPDPPPWGSQPVGSPLPQTQVLVLGGEPERLCGVGEPGEIVVRTPFRSLGYMPDAREQKPPRFRVNPFRQDAEDVLYFTGDRGRYRPDGVLEILGRLDDQVKIRGLRIEPAGIAAVLSRHPAVRECVVVARESATDERSLVAYLVPKDGEPVSVGDLRRTLGEELPDYMIPGAFVILDALPLTPNGKLDRRALPAPAETRPESFRRHVPPRDRFELELVHLWEELLPVRPVGVNDNFFELGGHSLLVLRLKSEIQERFGRSLALAEFFRGPTVEELAAVLRREAGSGSPSPIVPLRQTGCLPPLFCVHPAGGLVLGYRQLAECLGADVPFYGLQARGIESDEEPHTRIEEMARYYIAAMRTVQVEGPYHLAGWSFGGRVAFAMAQQLVAAGQPVALLALLDSSAPTGSVDTSELSDLSRLLASVAREVGLEVTGDELRALRPEGQLSHLAELAVRSSLAPDKEAALTYLRRRAAVYRGNVLAAAKYLPGIYPGPITYFRASDGSSGAAMDDPIDGWKRFSSGSIAVHRVPGNHRTMIREPHVASLAGLLRHALGG